MLQQVTGGQDQEHIGFCRNDLVAITTDQQRSHIFVHNLGPPMMWNVDARRMESAHLLDDDTWKFGLDEAEKCAETVRALLAHNGRALSKTDVHAV